MAAYHPRGRSEGIIPDHRRALQGGQDSGHVPGLRLDVGP